MPLTPFHLGPGLLIGESFEKKINMFSILAAGVLVDLRAFFCFFWGCAGRFHGPLHTFAGVTILALLISLIIWRLRKPLKKLTDFFKIKNNYSIQSIILGSFIGTWLHVIMDSFTHVDMIPYWPLEINFLLGTTTHEMNRIICMIAFVIGLGIYLYKLNKRMKSN